MYVAVICLIFIGDREDCSLNCIAVKMYHEIFEPFRRTCSRDLQFWALAIDWSVC